MGMKSHKGMKKFIAALLVIAGAAVGVFGVSLIYVPAALIVAGLALGAIGLFGIEVDKP